MDELFDATEDDGFDIEITVLGHTKTGTVTIVLGPLDAADVAPMVDHIQSNKNEFKERLIEHVASTVLGQSS